MKKTKSIKFWNCFPYSIIQVISFKTWNLRLLFSSTPEKSTVFLLIFSFVFLAPFRVFFLSLSPLPFPLLLNVNIPVFLNQFKLLWSKPAFLFSSLQPFFFFKNFQKIVYPNVIKSMPVCMCVCCPGLAWLPCLLISKQFYTDVFLAFFQWD